MSLESKTGITCSMEKVRPEKNGTWNECNKEESNIKKGNMERCIMNKM